MLRMTLDRVYTFLSVMLLWVLFRNGTKGTDENLPRALIFRDSFFTALEPFASPLFSEAEYRWKNFSDEDKSSVLLYKPDIIIFECVERYGPGLVR